MFLKVYQIYFSDDQLPLLEPEYTPLLNDDCTVFFESSVILNLIDAGLHKNHEYFAVVSYKLREKIGAVMRERWKNIPTIANHSLVDFSPALFEGKLRELAPDVMSFQRHMGHDPVTVADRFHPGFSNFFREIMSRIGFKWEPMAFTDVFYCNYFAARSEIYQSFVDEMLRPAMYVMEKMPELMQNSRYPNPLPEDLRLKFGITWYPYHAFLTERMFSYYVWMKKYKCAHF